MIKTVGVIGAGTMGNGIAQVFAQSGFGVLLHDASQAAVERGLKNVEKSLAKLVEMGKLSAADGDAARGRISVAPTLDAFSAADYVVEAVIEDLAAKRAIFERLDAVTRPDVCLTSNTSSISITTLGATT